jgi:ABC-type glycerol-3-phosphate transport system permease component
MSTAVAVRKFRAQPLKYVGRVLLYVIVLAGSVVFALPFIWMVRTSVMPSGVDPQRAGLG